VLRVALTLWATIGFALVDAAGPPVPLLLAAAAVFAVAVLAQVLAPAAPSPVGAAVRGAVLRDRARHRRLPRLLDPDGAGRPRPRAPSAATA
jgi:hypothetical protein